jgi:hypothetical protein
VSETGRSADTWPFRRVVDDDNVADILDSQRIPVNVDERTIAGKPPRGIPTWAWPVGSLMILFDRTRFAR